MNLFGSTTPSSFPLFGALPLPQDPTSEGAPQPGTHPRRPRSAASSSVGGGASTTTTGTSTNAGAAVNHSSRYIPGLKEAIEEGDFSILRHYKQYQLVREKMFDVNLASGEKAHYNPLADAALADFFRQPSVQRHLKKLGLVDKQGRPLSENDFRRLEVLEERRRKEKEAGEQKVMEEIQRQIEWAVRKTLSTSNNNHASNMNETKQASAVQEEPLTIQQGHAVLPEVDPIAQQAHELHRKQQKKLEEEQAVDWLAKYPPSMSKTVLLYTQEARKKQLAKLQEKKHAKKQSHPVPHAAPVVTLRLRPGSAKPKPLTRQQITDAAKPRPLSPAQTRSHKRSAAVSHTTAPAATIRAGEGFTRPGSAKPSSYQSAKRQSRQRSVPSAKPSTARVQSSSGKRQTKPQRQQEPISDYDDDEFEALFGADSSPALAGKSVESSVRGSFVVHEETANPALEVHVVNQQVIQAEPVQEAIEVSVATPASNVEEETIAEQVPKKKKPLERHDSLLLGEAENTNAQPPTRPMDEQFDLLAQSVAAGKIAQQNRASSRVSLKNADAVAAGNKGSESQMVEMAVKNPAVETVKDSPILARLPSTPPKRPSVQNLTAVTAPPATMVVSTDRLVQQQKTLNITNTTPPSAKRVTFGSAEAMDSAQKHVPPPTMAVPAAGSLGSLSLTRGILRKPSSEHVDVGGATASTTATNGRGAGSQPLLSAQTAPLKVSSSQQQVDSAFPAPGSQPRLNLRSVGTPAKKASQTKLATTGSKQKLAPGSKPASQQKVASQSKLAKETTPRQHPAGSMDKIQNVEQPQQLAPQPPEPQQQPQAIGH